MTDKPAPPSQKILVDTCVWIDFFRGTESLYRAELRNLLHSRRVILCGVVVAELLQGIRQGRQRKELSRAVAGFPYQEMTRDIWIDAGILGARLNAIGHPIPMSDLAIAALALQQDLAVFTFDKHFDHVAQLRRHRM